MPAELFRPAPVARRRAWLLPLSIAAHGVVLAGVFIAPIMADAELPDPAHAAPIYVEVTIPQMPPAPRPPGDPQPRPAKAAPMANPDVAPVTAPDHIAPTRETAGVVETAIPSGEGLGFPGVPVTDSGGGFVEAAPPRKPLRVGGDILPPKKIRDVPPRYPVVAQQARIEGTVIIEAVIGVDGHVQSARSLRRTPFLEDAALEAVRQWVFTPTRLNGEAVPVVMTVTVSFQLR
jgi:periplasmic protein TonB